MKKITVAILGFVSIALTSLTGCNKNTKNYDFTSVGVANFQKAGDDPISIRDVKESEGWVPAPSKGKTKYLVIPVDFEVNENNPRDNYSCAALPNGCEGSKAEIEAAFFGDSEDTGWESVKSFYYKSSYGALDFEGVVTDWYTVPFTASEAASMGSNYTTQVARDALKWYKSDEVRQSMGDKYIEPTDLDTDKDGYIDAIALIYTAPEKTYNSDFFWAYTTMNFGEIANLESPTVYQMFWGSYYFIKSDTTYEKPDSHTYIHETGHVLGLNDYYNTSYTIEAPAGKVDMMDNNVGDHCAYSKYSLGWIKPYVVDQEGSFTIKPFQENGDCLLVSANFNGSAFDEYLLIEFHTPTGLNQKDSESNYAGYYPRVMTANGIKIYHIDSRLAVVDRRGNGFIRYTDEFVDNGEDKTVISHPNTPNETISDGNYQVHLLEGTGRNDFIEKGLAADNSTLFKVGQQFGVNVFKNFKFNDGSELPFVFEITSITDEEAVITFVKK